jgi:PKD repeat protein
MKRIVYILILLISISSCKKDELQEAIVDNPEFFIAGSVGGSDINLVAGDNQYYMYSSFEEKNQTVPQYIGELKTEGCETNCTESFTLIFTGEKESAEGISGEPELRTGFKSFTNTNAGNEYVVTFNPDESFTSKAIEVEYEWEFGDGTVSQEKNPSHIYVGDNDYFDVKLSVKTSKGCQSEIENRVFIKTEATTDFVITQSQRSLAFRPDVESITPLNYLWEFESGSTASTPFVDYQTDPKKGIEKVCLTVTDENGKQSQRCKNLVLKEEYAFCAANYSFKSGSREDPKGDLQLGTVYLKYTDNTGKTYFSKPNFNNSNEFELTSIEDYEVNELGMPTKKIEFTANTVLTSNDGGTISVENINGSIAVAYRAK